MKKYLLFAQGNFKDYATIAYIVDAISDVTHSDFLKYRVGDGYSIAIHFGSNEEFVKLKDFIDIVMTKCSKAHYIVEYNDNMSVSMDENDLGTFLLIENTNIDKIKDKIKSSIPEDFKKSIDEINKELAENITLSFMENILDEDENDEDLLIKRSNKINYSIDDILDKINSEGIKSLTEQELTFLNSFSK